MVKVARQGYLPRACSAKPFDAASTRVRALTTKTTKTTKGTKQMKKTMQVVGTIHCGKPRYWLDGEEVNPENGQVACDRILIKGAFLYKETEDGPEKSGYASVFLDATEYAAKWKENCGEVMIDVVTTTVERLRSAAGYEYDSFSVTDGEYDPESLTFVEREKPSDRAAAFLARCKKQWSGFPKVIPAEVEAEDDTSDDIANA